MAHCRSLAAIVRLRRTHQRPLCFGELVAWDREGDMDGARPSVASSRNQGSHPMPTDTVSAPRETGRSCTSPWNDSASSRSLASNATFVMRNCAPFCDDRSKPFAVTGHRVTTTMAETTKRRRPSTPREVAIDRSFAGIQGSITTSHGLSVSDDGGMPRATPAGYRLSRRGRGRCRAARFRRSHRGCPRSARSRRPRVVIRGARRFVVR